jgi:hypothetical protein
MSNKKEWLDEEPITWYERETWTPETTKILDDYIKSREKFYAYRNDVKETETVNCKGKNNG